MPFSNQKMSCFVRQCQKNIQWLFSLSPLLHVSPLSPTLDPIPQVLRMILPQGVPYLKAENARRVLSEVRHIAIGPPWHGKMGIPPLVGRPPHGKMPYLKLRIASGQKGKNGPKFSTKWGKWGNFGDSGGGLPPCGATMMRKSDFGGREKMLKMTERALFLIQKSRFLVAEKGHFPPWPTPPPQIIACAANASSKDQILLFFGWIWGWNRRFWKLIMLLFGGSLPIISSIFVIFLCFSNPEIYKILGIFGRFGLTFWGENTKKIFRRDKPGAVWQGSGLGGMHPFIFVIYFHFSC